MVLWEWYEEVKTDHLRKVCVAWFDRISDAHDSSPYLGRFGGSEPGYGQARSCGLPQSTYDRSTDGHDRMEDKKQTASHRMRKPSKFQYVFVMAMNSNPSAAKVALDIRGINRVSTPMLTQMFI